MRRQVVKELRILAEDGQASWLRAKGSTTLPAIERLVSSHHQLDPTARPDAQLVCDEIEEACSSLDEEWRNAARIHLGYEWEGFRTPREDEAAEQLTGKRGGRMDGRAYRATVSNEDHKGRRYEGRIYDSWAEVTLTLVADALIVECGGDPEAAVDIEMDDQAALVPAADPRHAAELAGPRLGDLVRAEVSALYQPFTEQEFGKSFFHRDGTDAYIESLASLGAMTLYTGGAISPELHAPLSEKLLARSLKERLATVTGLNDSQIDRVIDALMRTHPTAHLGSIAREFVRQHSDADPHDVNRLEEESQEVFVGEMRDALKAGRDTGEFLALGLGTLTFALRHAGRKPVRILTTSYDDALADTETRVHEYFPDLRSYSFAPLPLGSAADPEEQAVPVYRLNGHVRNGATTDPLIIGEADSLTNHYGARTRLIDRALAETACVFVGTDLTEPDVLAKLATASYPEDLPRFAILLAPELGLDSPYERAKALNLVAQRFLHLGVVPIILDYPHQAPQFLIEVALRVQQGKEGYDSYAKRLQTWWGRWARDFGFPPGQNGRGGKRSQRLQETWNKDLAKVRDIVASEHLGLSAQRPARDERIQVEVWIRNPDERSLVLWCTSDGMSLNSGTAKRCYIYKGEDVPIQRAFREGTPVAGRVNSQAGWRYQLSIPLVLRKDPWFHLPVGVANILSTEGPPTETTNGEGRLDGGLLGSFQERPNFAKDLAALTSAVRKPINELLDPDSPVCRRRRLGRRG